MENTVAQTEISDRELAECPPGLPLVMLESRVKRDIGELIKDAGCSLYEIYSYQDIVGCCLVVGGKGVYRQR